NAALFSASLGRAQHALGHVAEARALLDRAWSIIGAAEGADPTYRSQVLHQLALVEAAQGETAQSLAHLVDALALVEDVRGASHASLGEILEAIADRHDEQGDPAAASMARQRAAGLDAILAVP